MANHQDVYNEMVRQKEANRSFVVATVVKIEGSSSAKPGEKAVFDEDGRRLAGWVGGGCVERMVGQKAREVIDSGKLVTLTIDLEGDDPLLSVPCGGKISIMVEPEIKAPVILINGFGRVVEVLSELADTLNFNVIVQTPKGEEGRYEHTEQTITDNRTLGEIEPQPDCIVLAAHHSDDNIRALDALKLGASYIAVIASRKRADIIVEFLKKNGADDAQLSRLHSPAGLNIKAETAEEIAVSIMAEIIALKNGGDGQPMGTLD